MKVTLTDPDTEETKQVKVGFSWVLFFWSCVFGIPLFLRKLHAWGCVFLALEIIGWGLNLMSSSSKPIWVSALIVSVGILSLSLWMGLRGNEVTAKNYLDMGWKFQNPTSKAAIKARKAWKLSAPNTAPAPSATPSLTRETEA